MKLVSLNTWGGKAGLNKLSHFLKNNKEIDIFCFQEVWHNGHQFVGIKAGGVILKNVVPNLYDKITEILLEHDSYFRPHFHEHYGLVIFIKKNIKVIEEGDIFVYKDKGYISKDDSGNHARNIQYLTFETTKGLRTVINFHGLWNGQGKTDTDDRLKQSDNIINFIKKLSNPFVISGDFNLSPDTKSIKNLEEFGLRNLIKEFNITSTRSNLYKKENRFADYVFINEGIKVKDFKVLQDEVSDHLPVYLDFE
jgi:exonuclease III